MSWHRPPRHRIVARVPIERRGAARAAVRRVEDQQPATARRTLRETGAELHAGRFGDAGYFRAAWKARTGALLRAGLLLQVGAERSENQQSSPPVFGFSRTGSKISLPADQASFLYVTRCGWVASSPRRRFLSASYSL